VAGENLSMAMHTGPHVVVTSFLMGMLCGDVVSGCLLCGVVMCFLVRLMFGEKLKFGLYVFVVIIVAVLFCF